MEYFAGTLTREESDQSMDRIDADFENSGYGLFAVELKESHEFIGFIGLHRATFQSHFTPCVEIGWRLAFPYWGKGLATEAAREALRVGFDQLQLPEIVSYTAVINRRSRAVMERLGMQEAAATFEHPAVPEGSPIRAHCLYRLSLDGWLAG